MSHLVLDGHKLMYHPDRVADFVANRDVAPIYVEISPAAHCNHRCLFCHYNYLGHQGKFPKGRMATLIDELSQNSVRSLVFAGVGEPMIHPETVPMIAYAKDRGIDTAMSTNGVLIKPEHCDILVQNLSWIRFSCNAGTPESYARIHQTKADDFEKVLSNIRMIVDAKRRLQSNITIGVQCIVLPENKDEVLAHAQAMKEIGVDYCVLKHFYTHQENLYSPDMSFIDDAFLQGLSQGAQALKSDTFTCIARSYETIMQERVYDKCYGLPFIVYIREDGEVYTCFSYQHDTKTSLGNILQQSFTQVWESKQKQAAFDYINTCIDKQHCQPNCRHHQINNYLWEIKHRSILHHNFI